MATILIKNGLLYDGTGTAARTASVLLQSGKIVRVGDCSKEKAETVFDATGAIIAPGFVDINTDSDHYLSIFTEPEQRDFVRQGVTTIIGGNCGSSLAPLLTHSLSSVKKWGDPSHTNIDWRTVGELLSVLETKKLGVNFGTLVGHATVRRGILGDMLRDLTDSELTMFSRVLEDAYREGAFGFSTGLSYAHSRQTPAYEIHALARTTAKWKRVYATHVRESEVGIVDAVDEAIAAAAETGVNMEISHLQPRTSVVPLYDEVFEKIEKASAISRIHFDVYPFDTLARAMYMFLPRWAQEGGVELMKEHVFSTMSEDRFLEYFKRYEKKEIMVGHVQDLSLRFLEGKSLREFAKNQGIKIPMALLRLLRITRLSGTLFFRDVDTDALLRAMARPQAIIASNGASFGDHEFKHERNYDSFPTFLRLVDAKKMMPMETAIAKITRIPAETYGIAGRGQIKVGLCADIAVLGTDWKPLHTVVNGVVALRDGEPQNTLSGAILRPNS